QFPCRPALKLGTIDTLIENTIRLMDPRQLLDSDGWGTDDRPRENGVIDREFYRCLCLSVPGEFGISSQFYFPARKDSDGVLQSPRGLFLFARDNQVIVTIAWDANLRGASNSCGMARLVCVRYSLPLEEFGSIRERLQSYVVGQLFV